MFEYPYNFHPDVRRLTACLRHRFSVVTEHHGSPEMVKFKCDYCGEVEFVPRASFTTAPSN